MARLVAKRPTVIEKKRHELNRKIKGYAQVILGPRRDKRKQI